MIDSCTIRDCVLTNPDISGAICLRNSSAEISYCEISSNTYDVDDNTKAAGIYLDEGQYLVNHCTIADNAVTGSPYGGGLYIEDGVHTISNCVIANNSPRGIFCWGDEETIAVIYCDLHGNYSSDFSGTVPTGLGLLSSTNANGDSCDVFYNIFLDPLFVNPDSGNYNLTANSPCIDAGDPESPLDPDGTIADMGAFYFPHTAGIAASSRKFIPDHFYLEPAFPNPFNPQTTLRFGLPIGSKVKLEVFDVNGRNVGAHGCALWSGSGATPTTEAWYPAGIHELTFEGSNLPSGVYLYRLTAGNFRAVGKMVLLK